MREILFRGKQIDNGEWAYGFYFEAAHSFTGEQRHFIQTVKRDGRIDIYWRVDQETVGQYTGLTDRNGNKIFEGDVVVFGDDLMVLEWHDDDAMFYMRCLDGTNWIENFSNVSSRLLEVIGNIYDNPEMMGGDANA